MDFVAWSRNTFGNTQDRLNSKHVEMEELMVAGFGENLDRIYEVRREINDLLHHEEVFWRQRSWSIWGGRKRRFLRLGGKSLSKQWPKQYLRTWWAFSKSLKRFVMEWTQCWLSIGGDKLGMSGKFTGSTGASCALLRIVVGWAFAIFMLLTLRCWPSRRGGSSMGHIRCSTEFTKQGTSPHVLSWRPILGATPLTCGVVSSVLGSCFRRGPYGKSGMVARLVFRLISGYLTPRRSMLVWTWL